MKEMKQNLAATTMHPKGEHNDMYLILKCFSARCVATMNGRHRVAIARHPPEGGSPSLRLIGAMFEFVKLVAK